MLFFWVMGIRVLLLLLVLLLMGVFDWGGGERVNEDGGGEVDSVVDCGVEEDFWFIVVVGLGVVGFVVGMLVLDLDGLLVGEVVLMIEVEVVVMSWVKLLGFVVLIIIGFLCLVDYWRCC